MFLFHRAESLEDSSLISVKDFSHKSEIDFIVVNRHKRTCCVVDVDVV